MKMGIIKVNRKLIIGIIVIILLISSFGIYKFINNSKTKSMSNQKASVADESVVITGSGTVQSDNTFEVTPVANGKITKVYFKEGDKVKTKDLMFEIDSSEAEMNVKKLTNALEQAKLQLSNDLIEKGYLTVTAPFSGQVSNILVKKGDVLITTGSPILSLADRSKLKLTVPFNSAQTNKMVAGLKAEVYINNINQSVVGTVSYISPNSHATDESGKLYNVEILIDNPGALKEGQKASAVIDADGEQISSPVSGLLSYVNSVVLEANSSGKVGDIDLKEDQYVNAGDVLMTLTNESVANAEDTDNLKIQDLQSQIDYANKQLEDYKIYAPIDGTISKQDIKVGQMVKNGDTISSIADLDHMKLVVDIDDTDIANIKLGQKANVKVDALPETSTKPIELQVTKIPVEGNTVNGTTTYPVTLSIDNVSEMKIGMNANIEIKVDKK
jgi:HlyD family secretion protein